MTAAITTSNTLTKAELLEIAKRIRSRTAQALIENGHDLLKAKAALPHGKFGAWLTRDVQITPRSAQRAMQVAEWVDTLSDDKYDTVSHLPRKHLYLLAAPSTPPGARDRAFNRLSSPSGKLDYAELARAVKSESELRPVEAVATEPSTGCRPLAASQVDAVIEEPEIIPPPPTAEKRRRASREVARDRFFDVVVSEVALIIKLALEDVPQLTPEEATQAAKQFEEIEGNLRRLRRALEKQRPKSVGEVVSTAAKEIASGDEDDSPLAIPAIFRREKTA